jgi:ketosteroid isomerase-like protein
MNTITTNYQIVELWYEHLQNLDAESICKLYDENQMKFEWPYAPNNFPKVLEGNYDIMLASVRGMFQGFKSLKVIEKKVMQLESPNTILVEWKGDAVIITGKAYKNTYVNLFKFENGKINEIIEYYNPLVIIETFLDKKLD